jgi:protein-disulfide isomerase
MLVKLWRFTLAKLLTAVKKVWGLAAVVLLSWALLAWSLPARAASRISPRVEEQVLQIIREHPEAILESVQAYQQQQLAKLQQAQQAFFQELKANPQAVIGQAPLTGVPESKITLIEFSDYECPYCGEAHKTLKQLLTKHQGEIKLVFKHYPLTSIHDNALSAAKAAWAAQQQGKFWEYHDALFTQQDKLGEDLYLEAAKKLNLDLEQFDRDRNSDAANTAIQNDMRQAQRLGISGTPVFLLEGDKFAGAVQLADVERILDRPKAS